MAQRYYPKSQRHLGQFTSGQEWMHPISFEEYKGPYHYYGKYDIVFTGASKTATSKLLIPYINVATDPQNFLYNRITDISLGEYIAPISKKPVPTSADISTGYMMRYFIKKSNDVSAPVIEIDMKQYRKCIARPGRLINGALFNKISLRWKIRGIRRDLDNIKGVEDTNRRTVYAKNILFNGLADLLRDLTRYTEYDQIAVQNGPGIFIPDFYETNGSEFVFTDGSPYTGFYHIHPTYGALVGKKHSNTFRQDKLLSFSEYAIIQASAK